MDRQDKKTIIKIVFALGALSLLTILIAYFVVSRRAPTAPISQPAAAPGCYADFFFPSPTPTATSTLTPTPTTTPTVTSTPIPHECGYTPCDASNNPCNTSQDLTCIQNQNNNLSYCARNEFITACQTSTSPGVSVCCYAPTSTPTPTPTPTPTQTLTPSPTPAPACDDLFASRTTGSEGESLILLTCTKTGSYTGAVTYDFMMIRKETKETADPVPTPTPFIQGQTSNITTYTIPANQYGFYLFMCRVCAGAFCTEWER